MRPLLRARACCRAVREHRCAEAASTLKNLASKHTHRYVVYVRVMQSVLQHNNDPSAD